MGGTAGREEDAGEHAHPAEDELPGELGAAEDDERACRDQRHGVGEGADGAGRSRPDAVRHATKARP